MAHGRMCFQRSALAWSGELGPPHVHPASGLSMFHAWIRPRVSPASWHVCADLFPLPDRPVEEVRRSQRLASSTVGRSSGAGARRLSSAGQVLGNSFVSKRGNSFTANR
ncbi:unnamed protein product [Prorocentrum cordatum]|uniref:Uncharacterized protein n=1 Tax=Prorocentrum cordatum TaxID=2364126 RepID=A0ABN9WL37_9DINO|nr:unnamed protein product [Polarella glacialis]